jgi:hypothetical protein
LFNPVFQVQTPGRGGFIANWRKYLLRNQPAYGFFKSSHPRRALQIRRHPPVQTLRKGMQLLQENKPPLKTIDGACQPVIKFTFVRHVIDHTCILPKII